MKDMWVCQLQKSSCPEGEVDCVQMPVILERNTPQNSCYVKLVKLGELRQAWLSC